MAGSFVGNLLRTGTLAVGGIGAAEDAAKLYERTSVEAEGPPGIQGSQVFPTDLGGRNIPYITMQFSAYKRRSIYQQPFFEPQMKIRLPIPENLVEKTSLDYRNTELGSVAGAALEALSGSLSGTGGTDAQRAAAIISGAGARAAQEALGAAVGSSAATTAINLASTLSGITTNPFQVVLFKSPDFKAHTFSWRLVPNTAQESRTIRDIIETFKYHSLPGISAAGGVFFSYPEVLELSFYPNDYYLYKFKPCVVKDVTVNYAPNSPSFYQSTNAPGAVQLTISLQEIEIWTKADWRRNESRSGIQAGRLEGREELGTLTQNIIETTRTFIGRANTSGN